MNVFLSSFTVTWLDKKIFIILLHFSISFLFVETNTALNFTVYCQLLILSIVIFLLIHCLSFVIISWRCKHLLDSKSHSSKLNSITYFQRITFLISILILYTSNNNISLVSLLRRSVRKNFIANYNKIN